MFNLRLSKFVPALLIAIASSVSLPALSQNTVIVTGTVPTCSGDCGGTLIGGSTGSSGGGTSNSGNPAIDHMDGNNDGTTGKSNIYNRTQPGCQREGYFWNETMSAAMAGNPPGRVIMTSFGDPLYQDAGWVKYENDRFYSEWRVGMPAFIEYRTTLHFMYNMNTGQVAQMKFKTSFQYGCQGFVKP